MKASIFSFLTFLILHSAVAQNAVNLSDLKLAEIMKGNEFIGYQPENIRWSNDGTSILFDWNPDNEPGSKTYEYSLTTKTISELTPAFYENRHDYYPNNRAPQRFDYFTHNGALYQYSVKSKTSSLIYKAASSVRNLNFVESESVVYFQVGSDLYKYNAIDLSTQIVIQFKTGEKPEDDKELNNLEKEELALFQFHQDNKEEKEWNKKQNEIWENELATVYHGKYTISNIQISTDERFVTYRMDKVPESKSTHVEHHISADGYTQSREARPKVSDDDPSHKMGIYDLQKDTCYFIDYSTLSDIRKKPAYLSEYGDSGTDYKEDRKIIMHEMIYSPQLNRNVIDIRSYDNKDRWIVSVDLESGKIDEFEHQYDEAWIGGPGISSWNMSSGTLGWLDDNKFYFQSEETGFSHLYTMDWSSKKKTQLTSGKWEVHNVELSKDRTKFYITANKTHPGDRGFYHLNVKNNELIPILTEPGYYEVSLSPDEKNLAVRYSTKTKPWELYTALNSSKSKLVSVTKSTTAAFDSYQWNAPNVITFKASDGVNVNARLYTPDEGKANGAAVFFVHGAGYLQNAHNYWSTYYREYMFHNMLRDNGYTIIDIDFRASEGYGRAFRTGIYRHMGGKDLSDQMDGRQLLIDSLGIDANRIGMYGGSYGGFITLMALLKEPGKFQAGAAIRSVTDWNHYNHEYTSNILNYPTTDPDAYKISSPIYYADNLENRLIMLHGMVDDNVQFQDVVRLSQRFIELGKKNWELAGYPVERHGFVKTSSWVDEYGRIFDLFNEELLIKQH